jgi:hypothetical protein
VKPRALDEQKAVILTDSRTACQILMKAIEGDRHNKIAMRILKIIQNAQKQIPIKWIPAHVGLERNEKADILAKDIEYSLQLKDAYRMLEQTQREDWNNWYVLKGKAYFELAPKIEPEPWYRNTKPSSVDTRTVNRIITTHTYTPNWLAKWGWQSRGCAISAKKKWECNTYNHTYNHTYNTIYTPA